MDIAKMNNSLSSQRKTHVKPIQDMVIEATYVKESNFYEIIEKRLGDAESIRSFWFCAGILTAGLIVVVVIIFWFIVLGAAAA